MNIKKANIENFGNRIRKLALFLPLCTYFYVIVEYTIPDPWSDPAPAKIDTGVGYIPTNRPAKTKIRVAPANQPTTGFSRGCRALNPTCKKYRTKSRICGMVKSIRFANSSKSSQSRKNINSNVWSVLNTYSIGPSTDQYGAR